MNRLSRTSTSMLARATLAMATGVACAAALAVAPASAAVDDDSHGRRAALPVLKGSVGPDFEISISDRNVPAGKYKLVVNDKGTIHNFHIFGAGVDEKTKVAGTGKTVYKIKLKVGTYNIQCDPHADVMNTTLKVT